MNFDLTRLSFLTNVLYVVLLSALFWSGWLLVPDIAGQGTPNGTLGTPLGRVVDAAFISIPILGVALSFVLMFINSLLVTRVCVRNVIFLERSYMPALIYVIVSAGYFSSSLSFRPLLVSTLLLVASDLIFRSYNVKSLTTGSYLKIGFYLGLTAAISAQAIFMFPILLIALLLFRLFDIREWLAAIVGYALPLFFSMYIDWLLGGNFVEFYDNFVAALTTASVNMPKFTEINMLEWGYIGTLTILIVLSVIKFISRRKAYSIKAFRSYLFFVWMFLISVIVMTFAPCRSLDMLPIIATPLAVMIPTYFNASKPSFIMNFLYALLVCEVVALHIVPKLLSTGQ